MISIKCLGCEAFLGNVANRQRLGTKLKLHCDRAFAARAKLATRIATNGNLLVRRGTVRHWNDEGALRMNVGMRVRGGLLAALIMFAVPVPATFAAVVITSPAVAHAVGAAVPPTGSARAHGKRRHYPPLRPL